MVYTCRYRTSKLYQMEKAGGRTVYTNQVHVDFRVKREIKHMNFTLSLPSTLNSSRNNSKRVCLKAETSKGTKNKRRKAPMF